MIRSLLRQCLGPDTLPLIEPRLTPILSKTVIKVSDLTDVLREVISSCLAHFIVIDGLDDCTPSQRDIVLNMLAGLLRNNPTASLKILVSSHDAMPQRLRGIAHDEHTVLQSHNAFNADVVVYIDNTLATRLEDYTLLVGNPNVILDIRNALLNGADGM